MMRVAAYLALAACAVVVEATWLAGFRPFGGTVDPLLLIVMSVGLLRGAEEGALAGAAAGLLQDVMTGVPLGLGTAANACVGFCAGLGGDRLYLDGAWVPALAAAALTVVRAAVWLGVAHLAGFLSVDPGGAARMIALSACYNGMVATPVFRWVRKFDLTVTRLSRRGA